ncbi:MAG: chemotaxis protein CheW [Chloroflexota bacterium]
MVDEPAFGGEEEQLLVFRLGDEYFAMLISAVHEIIRSQKITPVPRAPAFVEGVTERLGRIIPVIDLHKRFDILGRDDGHGRIVVAEQGDKLVGMVVDAVDEVLSVPTAAIEAPDEMVVSVDSQFLAGIVRLEERLIILLDHEQVLSPGELRQLGNMKVPERTARQARRSQAAEDEPEPRLIA